MKLPKHELVATLVIGALLAVGCGEERAVAVADPVLEAPPSGEASSPIVVRDDGQRVDPATARAIAGALHDLQNGTPEAASPEDLAAARDASALHGRWNIRHTVHRTNGEASEPAEPIMPASWVFTPAGDFQVRGGNAIDARYVYTGDRIVVSGFGPVQDYRVDQLDREQLQVTTVIEAGSLRLENTTVLDRAP